MRNIGIIAHIDAGKTTTTERMLYYSGRTKRPGSVDHGDTITDFLPAERKRGITIQSAAITFHWPPQPVREIPKEVDSSQSYTINLIDTPGHADFTFEVLRSLRVLDGAVCILDGVAGVEAQTEKVWHQARAYDIPAVFFVNKLDRDGATFGKTVIDIAAKLRVQPAVCQIPWFQNDTGPLRGVVDVIHLQTITWSQGDDGKTVRKGSLQGIRSPTLLDEVHQARKALIETLSQYDHLMIDTFMQYNDDHMAIPPEEIIRSLRHCLLHNRSIFAPVFAGASKNNIGVQPVLDSITNLLPDPTETPDPQFRAGSLVGGLRDLAAGKIALVPRESSKSSTKARKGGVSVANLQHFEACALAFKVVYDRRRGVLVYVRVYHGVLHKNAILFNTNLQESERAPQLLRMYAEDAEPISSIKSGEIGVITGLKLARTGDTLISYSGVNHKNGPPTPLNALQLRPINIPPPVFFAAIEPYSQADERHTDELLEILVREDPSLQLSINEDSGQKLLSGMGELHLEIAGNRLTDDLKANAKMGEIEIGYRECPIVEGDLQTALFARSVAGKFGKAGCESLVSVLDESEAEKEKHLLRDGNIVHISIRSRNVDGEDPETKLPSKASALQVQQALRNGAFAALARGPGYTFQVYGAKVQLFFDPSRHFFGEDSTLQALSSAARKATHAAMKAAHEVRPFAMVEPIMSVTIDVDEKSLGPVMNDLSSARGGRITSYNDESSNDDEFAPSGDTIPPINLRNVYAPSDPFETTSTVESDQTPAISVNNRRLITARVPLRSMLGYLPHLRSLTGGRGTFIMNVDRFQKMDGNTQRIVMKKLHGL